MRRPRHALVLLALAAAGACGELPDDPVDWAPPDLPFEYSTEHLEIHSDVERCEGDFARWEGFIDYAEDYLGLTMPDSVEVYVWEPENFDSAAVCRGVGLSGCYRTSEGVVFSSAYAIEHELVHALTDPLANHDAFFSEGVATALASPTAFGEYGPTFPVKDPKAVDYASAGHFVRWLLEVYGAPHLLMHMSMVGGEPEFEAVYGEDLATLTTDYFANAATNYPILYRHSVPAFELQAEGVWSAALDFSCDRGDVRGTKDGLEVIRELTLPKSGFYAFWSSTGGPIRARQGSVNAFALTGDEIAGGPVEAGVYEISVTAPPDVEFGTVIVWEDQATVPAFPGQTP